MKLKPAIALLMAAFVISSNTHAENYAWDTVTMGGDGFVTGIVTSKTARGVIYARIDVGAPTAGTPRGPGGCRCSTYFNDGKTAILRSSDYGKRFTLYDVSAQLKASHLRSGKGGQLIKQQIVQR